MTSRLSSQRYAVWGFIDMTFHLGQIIKKTQNWTWIAIFKPNSRNIKQSYYWNYYTDLTKFCLVFLGGLNVCTTYSRWCPEYMLKNDKSPYLGNGLTDRHQIWHIDAHWPSEPYRSLRFQIVDNLRWRMTSKIKSGGQ